jgi:uncharacterized protein (TIGR04222 family)
MTDTWGIPGPLFTGLYLGLLLIPLLYALLRARALLRGHAGGSPQTAEELALLTGERTRVGEVVIARLLERGLARMDGTGRLHRVRSGSSDVLDRAALERISKTGTSVDAVRTTVCRLPAVAELEAGLAARGLVTVVRKLRSSRVSASVAYWVLFVVGVARLIAGSSAGHPVGYLLGLLVLNVVAAIAVTVRAVNTPEAKATAAGRSAAEEARRAGTLTSGATGAVASGGLSAYPDKEIRAAVSRATHAAAKTSGRRPGRSSWAGTGGGAAVGFYGGGSSCSGGGGSSCGGGGGGGGGGCGG